MLLVDDGPCTAMPTSVNLLQAAQQGNPKAIAALMNQALAGKGTTVYATLDQHCLYLVFRSAQPLQAEALIHFTRRGLHRLGTGLTPAVAIVKIYAQQGATQPPVSVKGFRLTTHPAPTPTATFAPPARSAPPLTHPPQPAPGQASPTRTPAKPWVWHAGSAPRLQRYGLAAATLTTLAISAIAARLPLAHQLSITPPKDANRKPVPPVLLYGDSNRDGLLSAADIEARQQFSFSGAGAFFIANVDDDNADGQPDAFDQTINGKADAADLAHLRIQLSPQLASEPTRIHLQIVDATQVTQKWVRVFERVGDRWVPVDLTGKNPLSQTGAAVEVAIEARHFASGAWNGLAVLQAEVRTASGKAIAQDQATLRVAPWIMLPNSAPTEEVYVATGQYDNTNFIAELRTILGAIGVPAPQAYPAQQWQQAWAQDAMEIGYTQLPGQAPMSVVLQANRGGDGFVRSLLKPNMGYITVGTPRPLSGPDQWADWFGNLEVSHATPTHPLGRIYYGLDTSTGIGLHPEVVQFLKAQEVQAPIWLDTSWLAIKHVDEILNFLPGAMAQGVMMVNSPEEAGKLVPGYDAYNRTVQTRLNAMLKGASYPVRGHPVYFADMPTKKGLVMHPGALAAFEIAGDRIVRLPVLYSVGQSLWSNPVNSVYVNGVVIAGKTNMPLAVHRDLEQKWKRHNAQVFWIDDSMYQANYGNVHCATNTRRTPFFHHFWLPL